MSYAKLYNSFEVLNERKRQGTRKLAEKEMEHWRTMRCLIEEVLFDHMSDPIRDSREHLRVPILLQSRYWIGDQVKEHFLVNIGEGGVYVSTLEPQPEGTQLEIEVASLDKQTYFKIKGQVAWANETGKPEDRGMGVKFTQLSTEQRQTIYSLVDEIVYNALAKLDLDPGPGN